MSYKFFFFACALNLFYSAQNLLASPIIGGHEDTSNDHKYHVSIRERHNHRNLNSGKLLCGGAIIHDRYILTAAHCFMTKTDGRIKFIRKLRNRGVVVLAGTSETDGPGIIRDVRKVFIPRAYDLGQEKYGDIAIVQLAMNLKLALVTGKVHILPLDSEHHPLNFYENKNAFFPGNGCDVLYRGDDGVLRPQPNRVAQLRKVLEVHMLERSDCPLYFDHSICALSCDRSQIGACAKGDSGSPLVYKSTIIGVLSRGPTIFQEDDIHGMVFTRVPIFINFIWDAMNEHGDHSQIYTLDH